MSSSSLLAIPFLSAIRPQHPDLAALMDRLLSCPQDELPELFSTVPHWRWPRSDLHSWVKVLNKLDTILKDIIQEYDIDNLQGKEFTAIHKSTLLEILRFETLLLENSTNRKLFSSYDVSPPLHKLCVVPSCLPRICSVHLFLDAIF